MTAYHRVTFQSFGGVSDEGRGFTLLRVHLTSKEIHFVMLQCIVYLCNSCPPSPICSPAGLCDSWGGQNSLSCDAFVVRGLWAPVFSSSCGFHSRKVRCTVLEFVQQTDSTSLFKWDLKKKKKKVIQKNLSFLYNYNPEKQSK